MNTIKEENLNENENLKESSDKLWWFFILLIIISIIWAISWYLVTKFLPDWQTRSSFGEMFGAVNALFSGLALAGVVFAILLQRKELMLQRQELKMTREELRRSAEAQEKSEAALVKQAEAMETTAKLNTLNFLPLITCDFILSPNKLDEDQIHISIMNPGNSFAFDLNVYVLGTYDGDKTGVNDFVTDYVFREPEKFKNFKPDENGFFSIFDNLEYFLLPNGKKFIASLYFPEAPDFFHVLIQFRDAQGNNYHRLYWLYKNHNSNEKGFRVGDIQPKVFEMHPRIDFNFENITNKNKITPDLITEDKSHLPKHITEEFIHHWQHSIPVGYIVEYPVGPEDRGSLMDIQ